jgi:protein TonB
VSQSTLRESGLRRWRRAALEQPLIRDPLAVALLASLLLHAIVMFARLSPPIKSLLNPADSRLEVILLNARTLNAPLAPEVLAQVNQEGGGENERGRARSPLPAAILN